MSRKFLARALLACVLATAFGPLPVTAEEGGCADPAAGGDWTQHGGDAMATRSQSAEATINPGNVTNLSPQWSAAMDAVGGAGIIQTIPIIADGCVYLQTSSGGFWLVALNADTGAFVWKYPLGSGGCHNAPLVRDGKIYINDPTQSGGGSSGPHLVVLDAQTGEELVVGEEVATEPSTGANAGCAAPVALLGDVALIGITNGEFDGRREGGFALVNATTGAFIKRTYVVPDEQAQAGFGGCSIWSGWAIDEEKKVAYTTTAQPSTWVGLESEFCNAIIKVDLDPSHTSTYGEIIGAVKGTRDEPPYIDVDFGTALTSVTDETGRQMVGALQKSGHFHAAYTNTMTAAFDLPVSPVGGPVGNHTASASDGQNFYTVGAYPGQLFSIDSLTGLPNWVAPVVAPIATNSVAHANGVVYYGDEKGWLSAFDAATGLLLYTHPVFVDNQACLRNQSGGVAIARGHVYMACGPVIAAFSL